MIDAVMRTIAGTSLMILTAILAFLFDGTDRVFSAIVQRTLPPSIFQPFLDLAKLFDEDNIVPKKAVSWAFNAAPWVAASSISLIFLYIPIGSLPPVLGAKGDLILVIYLLGLSGAAMAIGGFASGNQTADTGAKREMILMMSYELALAVVVATLAWMAYKTGMPGDPFNLETFVGMSIWSVVGKVGFVGVFCLMLSMLLVVPGETGKMSYAREERSVVLDDLIVEYSGRNLAMFKLTFVLRALVLSALIVALFFPWTPCSFLRLGGSSLFVFDFIWFWMKVFAVRFFVVTLKRTLFGRFNIRQASEFYLIKVGGLSIAGMILASLDLVI